MHIPFLFSVLWFYCTVQVISLQSSDYGMGPNAVRFGMNFQTGKTDLHNVKDVSRNIHGDNKFLIKIQLGKLLFARTYYIVS